jgi:hypothetical protein
MRKKSERLLAIGLFILSMLLWFIAIYVMIRG